MNRNKQEIIEKIEEIKKQEKEYGIKINLDPNMIHENRQDVLWYGGDIGSIENDRYIVYISAYGDVIADLFIDSEPVAYIKDKSNNGAFYDEFHNYIKDDNELQNIRLYACPDEDLIDKQNGKPTLFIDNNNWIEFNIFDKLQNEWVDLDFDNVLEDDDVLSVFDGANEYFDCI